VAHRSASKEKLLRLADLERRAQGGRVLLREDVAEVVGLGSVQQEKLLAAARATNRPPRRSGGCSRRGTARGTSRRRRSLRRREREPEASR
jgi:hypothetical protein